MMQEEEFGAKAEAFLLQMKVVVAQAAQVPHLQAQISQLQELHAEQNQVVAKQDGLLESASLHKSKLTIR